MTWKDNPAVALCSLGGSYESKPHVAMCPWPWEQSGREVTGAATKPSRFGFGQNLILLVARSLALFNVDNELSKQTAIRTLIAELYCVAVFIFFLCALLSAELWQLNRTWVFQGHGASLQPQTMLLDEGHERLYVGAKNTLFSLSLDRVNTHQREVGLCSSLHAC